jgi:segregation and condensation protein A
MTRSPTPTVMGAEAVRQPELPLATVNGEPWLTYPEGLYIPPDALRLLLESFEGPLDLLWHLIRRQNLDVLNIPVAQVTEQYLHYIGMMQQMQLELAGEYLYMVAYLANLKARMLIPRPVDETGEEPQDARAALVQRLQEYEIIRRAAERLDALPRLERDLWQAHVGVPESDRHFLPEPPPVALEDWLRQMARLLDRTRWQIRHRVVKDALSVRECMASLLERLSRSRGYQRFEKLLPRGSNRARAVVSFLALLELVRQSLVNLVQATPYGPLYVQAPSSSVVEEAPVQETGHE